MPFALFYTLPYVAGFVPTPLMKSAVLSLLLVPLSLAYAIVRYRLMDVDILFRRGYAYTLATLCVLAAFYGIIFSLASIVQKNFQDLGNTGLITVMLVAAFLFQPVRNWIQERLDRTSIAISTITGARWWNSPGSSVRKPISTPCSTRWRSG
jgi:hypothetical protein